MAGYNPSDISFSIIKEATPGTTPASGVLLKLDHVPGTSPNYTSDFIESPVLQAKRASAGNRKVNYRAEGGLKVHFCRDAAVELLLASAFSGTWVEAGGVGEVGDTLKASDTDTSFTIEKKTGSTSSLYSRFKGCQVSKFSLTVDAAGNAEASFDIIGMGRDTATVATSLTYAQASEALKLAGLDVTNVSIGGLSNVQYRSLELNVEHTREAKDVFGSASAVGVGTSGNRKVSGSLSFYRENLSPETVLAGDTAVPIGFTIGTGSDGYVFLIPAATANVPMDEEDGSKLMVKVEFSAKYDNTAGTDCMVTRT